MHIVLADSIKIIFKYTSLTNGFNLRRDLGKLSQVAYFHFQLGRRGSSIFHLPYSQISLGWLGGRAESQLNLSICRVKTKYSLKATFRTCLRSMHTHSETTATQSTA